MNNGTTTDKYPYSHTETNIPATTWYSIEHQQTVSVLQMINFNLLEIKKLLEEINTKLGEQDK